MKISAEIKKTAYNYNLSITELSDGQTKTIKSEIKKKYAHAGFGRFLCEQLEDAAVATDCDGWEKLCDFVGSYSCIMFFDAMEDDAAFFIKDGKELHKLLSEMYGFEFYICNFAIDYLLCFNHHDSLIGCGIAKEWVESLKQ